MTLDYRYLKAFIFTAKYASFSKAAEELRIAQSAVSRQIRLLEEGLECQLLVRSPQKVMLTEMGKKLFEQALRFDDWSTREFADLPTNIRLGTVPGLLDNFLIPKVAKFAKTKDLNFFLRADSQPVVVSMLTKSELDACLVHAPVQLPGVICKSLMTEDIFIISKTDLDLDKLSEYRWIHMGTAQHLQKFCKTMSPHQIVVNSISAIVELVSAGLGIAAVPDYVVAGVKTSLRAQKLNFKGQIYLAYWDYGIWPAHMKEFLDYLSIRPG